MRYLTILVVLISLISGCGRSLQIIRHSYVTNYTMNAIETAYTGQSIVKVKDYYAFKNYTTTFLSPTESFLLTANVSGTFNDYKFSISGLKGKRYETYYSTNINGIFYKIIHIPDSNGSSTYGILIDDDGNIKNNSFYYGKETKTPNFTLQPPNVKFNKSVINHVNFFCDEFINYSGNTCGDVNYELIYSGINNVSMNITYREFTRTDYARPAFYQNLTYEPTSKQIRFKNFEIEILEANNDKIVYKILRDDLKETEFVEGEDLSFERIKRIPPIKK